MPDFVNFSMTAIVTTLENNWPAISYVAGGAIYTVVIIVGAMSLGFILGMPMAAVSVYGPRWAKWLVRIYTWYFRGIPILVLLFMFYFGIFVAFENTWRELFDDRLTVPPLFVGALVLGLTSGAYQSQIFRGAILSLPSGQFKAAKALGMSHTSAVINIIIPQTIRVAVPAWSNEYSILLKDSAVVSVLGVPEIMFRAHAMGTRAYNHLPMYFLAGLLFFILTFIGVRLLKKFEKKYRIPGLAHEASGPGFY